MRATISLLLVLVVPIPTPVTAQDSEPRPQRTFSGHHHEVYSVAFSPDGTILASAEAYFSSDPALSGTLCIRVAGDPA